MDIFSNVAPVVGAATGLALAAFSAWYLLADADLPVLMTSVPAGAFRGKRVVIIGASTGIGRALALRLSRDGASIAVCSRSEAKLRELAAECLAAGAPKAVAHVVDVLDLDSHASLGADLAALMGGPIDVLVNNAGRSQRSLAEDTDIKVTADMMQLNVIGNISVTKAFLPAMLDRGSGHIMVTSSVAGKVGAPCSSSYAATKHAVQGYYSALRNEVSYRGVDVTLVCPGPVESEITKHAFTAEAGVKAADAGFKEDKSKRMTAERCAELMARALHNSKLYEIWVSPQPILLFTVLYQIAPTFASWVGATKVGPARVEGLRMGKPGYEAVQGLGVIFGAGAKAKKRD
ncbi:hypothetical protein FNF27_06772 [Cafeteria roenbergensis]|uniref:Ketoreductase domain-containing protein n=2 Tax=Cafeteria roenbergensis TaxID=33653 RepID=A0A5A8CNB8_CAFRO|nr:hypothetical protein FNF29_03008 [Cafeteria roenbergensis]KAA0163513.1 hypothetical protein FNF31_02907 [Cafeteria roenbergensis]KAA0170019.1 hypothetical protein FNF27_06772 [Cafeteria roenbergensis]|eukprot:KAA0153620.1 hypothetical protein FNF29_03008 [Cafeteria roenbergensis]